MNFFLTSVDMGDDTNEHDILTAPQAGDNTSRKAVHDTQGCRQEALRSTIGIVHVYCFAAD